jgi:phosphatidylglycerol:prolipoprotein diacylglycerol transferase
MLGYLVAFGVYFTLRHSFGDRISTPVRWAVLATGVAGASLGSKILYWLEDPELTWQNLHNPAYLVAGKTIVGALALGLITVELVKRFIGLRESTGDLYAIPLAAGIAIGRVGCFLTGLSDNTFGTPTQLPWGVDFGDGIRRHPTQLYEIAFLVVLIPILHRLMVTLTLPSGFFLPGDVFRFYMVSYASFRLLCDFIKPYPRIFLDLGGIQWACVLLLLYYSRDITRWLQTAFLRSRNLV